MHSEEWGEYPFPNFNVATVEVWEYISNSIPLRYCASDY